MNDAEMVRQYNILEEERSRYRVDLVCTLPQDEWMRLACGKSDIEYKIIMARINHDRAVEAAGRIEMERYLKANERYFVK